MSEFPPVRLRSQLRSAARLLTTPRPAERRKWLLFAQGRTGSTLFGELLASHPDVVFADEILRAKVTSTRLWAAGQRRRYPDQVYGFHAKVYQLTDDQGIGDPARWLRRMSDDGWRVLALRRRNLLRHVLSNMTINATATVHDRTGGAPTAALHVDPAELVHWMGVRQRVGDAELQALDGVPHESFVYEDDLEDSASWPATADRAFGWIGVSPAPVTSTLRRRNRGDLRDLIANYDEVATAVHGTPYERYLTD